MKTKQEETWMAANENVKLEANSISEKINPLLHSPLTISTTQTQTLNISHLRKQKQSQHKVNLELFILVYKNIGRDIIECIIWDAKPIYQRDIRKLD